MFLLIIYLFNVCFAGEERPEGYVLREKSYVFSIDEAEKLKLRIIELEKKEAKLKILKKESSINLDIIKLYKENEAFYKTRIDNYNQIVNLNEDIILDYKKRQKHGELQNFGYFLTGIALTVGSFIIVDKINDHIIIPQPN